MTKEDLKMLKRVGYNFGIKTLRWGNEELVPTKDGLVVQFKQSITTAERICHISFRYNGDEVMVMWKGYWTPTGIFWWEHSTYNMRTLKPMRRKAAVTLVLDQLKRARIKAVDTSEVFSKVVDGERILTYKGHTFKHHNDWLTYFDDALNVVDKYCALVENVKDAKAKAILYVQEHYSDEQRSLSECK